MDPSDGAQHTRLRQPLVATWPEDSRWPDSIHWPSAPAPSPRHAGTVPSRPATHRPRAATSQSEPTTGPFSSVRRAAPRWGLAVVGAVALLVGVTLPGAVPREALAPLARHASAQPQLLEGAAVAVAALLALAITGVARARLRADEPARVLASLLRWFAALALAIAGLLALTPLGVTLVAMLAGSVALVALCRSNAGRFTSGLASLACVGVVHAGDLLTGALPLGVVLAAAMLTLGNRLLISSLAPVAGRQRVSDQQPAPGHRAAARAGVIPAPSTASPATWVPERHAPVPVLWRPVPQPPDARDVWRDAR